MAVIDDGPAEAAIDTQSVPRVGRGHLLVLGAAALLGTLPFWLTDLDLRVAAFFYRPGADDPWPFGALPFWQFLYHAAPILMGFVVLGSGAVVVGGLRWQPLRSLRLPAVLVVAATLVGPGLLVNALFKEHWGRPRPHQVETLGGAFAYQPPLLRSTRGEGRSFPCGHSSVGYGLGVFFFIWRRRRPGLARVALFGSVTLGTLLGIGRMVAGDHFLSDVIWSGILVYGATFALSVVVIRPSKWVDLAVARRPAQWLPGWAPSLRPSWVCVEGGCNPLRCTTCDPCQGETPEVPLDPRA